MKDVEEDEEETRRIYVYTINFIPNIKGVKDLPELVYLSTGRKYGHCWRFVTALRLLTGRSRLLLRTEFAIFGRHHAGESV